MPRVNRNYLIAACIFVLLTAVSCSQDGPVQVAAQDSLQQVAGQDAAADSAGLVGLAGLDAIRGAAMLHDDPIDVTAPLVERNTQVNGEYLDLVPTATEFAWAVYRVESPEGNLLSLDATGSDTLYLMVADYEQGWAFEPFEGGAASIDLTTLGDVVSPEGYIYCGAACPVGETGTLTALHLAYDDLGAWNLEITTDEDGVTLTWNELDCDGYEIYRSTLADDPYPCQVGTVAEDHDGGNSFIELVPEDGLGRWVPENNDNDTVDDTIDDFLTVAPAVEYHYRVRAIFDDHDGPESPEVSGTIPWGGRSTTVRTLPDSTNQTRLFGAVLSLHQMTEGQIEWTANNMVGCPGVTQGEIDQVRAINPEFICMGSQFGYFSCEEMQAYMSVYIEPNGKAHYPQIYGNEIGDEDGNYPYVSRHESWYLHDAESEFVNQRVSSKASEDYYPYWMEMDSPWLEYVGDNILQLTGEDGFDGWIIDNCTTRTMMYPSPYEDHLFNPEFLDYVLGINNTLMAELSSVTTGHPRRPLIMADAFTGYGVINNFDEEPHFLDYSDCDLVYYSDFVGSVKSETGIIEEFIKILGDEVLNHLNAGRGVVMNYRFDYAHDEECPFTAYACYLLARGSASYFSLHNYTYKPVYVIGSLWDTGAPVGPQPTCMDDLRRQSQDELGNPVEGRDFYWREFENGFVVMAEQGFGMYLGEPKMIEYLDPGANGNAYVLEDGSQSAELYWTQVSDPISSFWINHGGCYVFREVPAE